MTRPLEFRAWDKATKEWSTLITAQTLGNFVIIDNSILEIEQFTGLLDKNGTKIFEGDIVSEDVYPDDKVIVKYPFNYFTDSENGVVGEDVEVIGNIHQHPELLESK